MSKAGTSAAGSGAGDAEAAATPAATESDKTVPLPAGPIGGAPADPPVDNSAAAEDSPEPPAPLSAPVPEPESATAPRPAAPYSVPSSYPRPAWTNPETRAGQAPPSSNGHLPGDGPAWRQVAPANANQDRRWLGAQTRKPSKRQAMLTLARVEPWSVMKFSFVASVAAFIILFVAVALLYLVLSALGVFDSIQNTVSSVTSSQGSAGTNISHWFSASLILGYTAMLGAFNIVIITAISTVGSVIYNLIAKLFGGIEVTLRETD